MLNELNFPFEGKVHGTAITEDLKAYFKAQRQLLGRYLIPDLSYLDPRALPVDGIQVNDVEYIEENKYRIHYQYDWAAFGGCVGLDENGTDTNKVSFKLIDDGSFEFDLTALGRNGEGLGEID